VACDSAPAGGLVFREQVVLTFYFRGISDACGLVELTADPTLHSLAQLRGVMAEELDESGLGDDFAFLQGPAYAPVSRKQEERKPISAVLANIAPDGQSADVFLKRSAAATMTTAVSMASASSPVHSEDAVSAPPVAPPMAPSGAPAPGAYLVQSSPRSAAATAAATNGSDTGSQSSATSSSSSAAGGGGGPSNALLDAIRAGPKLRKTAGLGGEEESDGTAAGSDPRAGVKGRGVPVGTPDLMSQL